MSEDSRVWIGWAAGRARSASARLLLLCMVLVISPPMPLTGQTREQVRERLDSLIPRTVKAWDEAHRVDSLKRERERLEREVPTDTLRVGPFQVIARDEQRDLAEAVFSRVWAEFAPILAGSEHLLEGWRIAFEYAENPIGIHLDGDKSRSLELEPSLWGDDLEVGVSNEIGIILSLVLPEDLRKWLAGHNLAEPVSLPWRYRRLVTAPSHTVRRCMRGDLEWCWDALGATEPDDKWARWYEALDRREFIRSRGRYYGPNNTLYDGCAEGWNIEACDALLKLSYDVDEVPVPLDGSYRAHLVHRALQRGGTGSFQRLVSSGDMLLPARLAYTAGMSEEALIGLWRTENLRIRPRFLAGMGRTGLTALLWIAVLLSLAARSTRWRLG